MNSDTIHTVWLDLDDTLIDFRANAAAALSTMWNEQEILQQLFTTPRAWTERYEHHNHALWAQYSRAEISREYLRMERFRRPLTEAGLPESRARTLSTRYDTYYLDLLAEGKVLIPGAIELLHYLRQRSYTIGILSNGFREVQFRKIRNTGLEPLIDIVVLSDDIGINKPDPRIYQYAMERSGNIDPATHLMIGDNPDTDIAGAIAARWKAIWYHPSRQVAATSGHTEVAVVNTLEEIPQILNT